MKILKSLDESLKKEDEEEEETSSTAAKKSTKIAKESNTPLYSNRSVAAASEGSNSDIMSIFRGQIEELINAVKLFLRRRNVWMLLRYSLTL